MHLDRCYNLQAFVETILLAERGKLSTVRSVDYQGLPTVSGKRCCAEFLTCHSSLFNYLFGQFRPLSDSESEEITGNERRETGTQLDMNWRGAVRGCRRGCSSFVIFLISWAPTINSIWGSSRSLSSKYLKTTANETKTVRVARYSKREYVFFSEISEPTLRHTFTWLGGCTSRGIKLWDMSSIHHKHSNIFWDLQNSQ